MSFRSSFSRRSALTSLFSMASLAGLASRGSQAEAALRQQGPISVRAAPYLAVGDGDADDTLAIQAAIAEGQRQLTSVHFPPGVYRMSSTIRLNGSPTALVGDITAPHQQGSTRPSVTLRWHGGAAPMFVCASSSFHFHGMAIENFGAATDFLEVVNGQAYVFRHLSVLVGAGASPFSRSVFRSTGNNLGYSVFDSINCHGAAPKFIDIAGSGSNGITPIEIRGRSIFESNEACDLTVVHVSGENLEALKISGCTFNQQSGRLVVLDTTGSGEHPALTQFTFEDNEIDIASSAAGDRLFRLVNVVNVSMNRNTVQGGGMVRAIAQLVDSTVTSFHGNYVERVNGPFFEADGKSRVYPGVNQFQLANTNGVVNDSAQSSGDIPLSHGELVVLRGDLAEHHGTVFRIDVADRDPWTLSLAHPGVAPGGYFTKGQTFKLMIRNLSGGHVGPVAIAGGAGLFKLAGGTLPLPASGHSRTVELLWNGRALVEVGRTPLDVPN